MADPTNGTAGDTPAQITPAAAPTAVAPVTPAAAPAAPADPEWLPARLTRAQETARTALLTELGVTDPAKAKAFIEAGQKAEDEKKTLADKLVETTTGLTTAKAQAEKLCGIVALQATAQMSALTVEQQAAVKAIAGEDPAEQLRTVIALSPTWRTAVPVAAPVAPVTPPATTSPAPAAPPGATTSPTDHKAVHAQLDATNPFEAAAYARLHPQVWSP